MTRVGIRSTLDGWFPCLDQRLPMYFVLNAYLRLGSAAAVAVWLSLCAVLLVTSLVGRGEFALQTPIEETELPAEEIESAEKDVILTRRRVELRRGEPCALHPWAVRPTRDSDRERESYEPCIIGHRYANGLLAPWRC